MKKELSMEVRLLIAFVLMGIVLLVSQYLIKPVPVPKSASTATAQPAAPAAPAQGSDKADAATPVIPSIAKQKAAEVAPEARAASEELTTVDTGVYHVVFSNRGATVRSWVLKDYKDHAGRPLDLVYQPSIGRVPAPFAVAFKGQAPSIDLNNALFATSRYGLDVAFEFSDGKVLSKKTFHFEPNSYLVGVTSEVTQNGAALPHQLTWRGGFGDRTVRNPASVQHAIYYDLPNTKLKSMSYGDAKNGPVSAGGQFSFAGIEDSYFTAVFLPGDQPSPTEVTETTYADSVPDAEGKDEKRVGVGVGGDGLNTLSLFVGPKDTDLLKKVNPKLEQVVDWGWFGIIAKPLFLVINWTTDHVAHNYGWSIVLVTLVINIVLFPLKISSMKSSKKMQALQPQIKAINDKYKGLSMKDPKKADQNAEVMELYKKNGVNPVGGCLPMLLQMPFLYAFYKVLGVSTEMRGAHWLWVGDLSQPETLAIHLLPLLLVATQFLMQRMTPSPGVDPSQQKMMMFMPLMFGYMFYFASAGLVLYWLTGNVVGIVQQWLLNKSMPAAAAPPAKPPSNKKGRN